MREQEYWIYILKCGNGSYYTGYTTDLARRFREHQTGTGKCKYTRSFKALTIAQCWKSKDKSAALKIERYIKTLSKTDKEKLIANPNSLYQQVLNKNFLQDKLKSIAISAG